MIRSASKTAFTQPLLLALAAVLVFASARPCHASGALPWLAPGQQTNATIQQDNATLQQDNATHAQPSAATTAQAKPAPASPGALPDDADAPAQYEVLRQFFRRQVTLDESLPLVFSRRVRDAESFALLAARETMRRRGLLERFGAAEVDLGELVFTRITADPDLARIRVNGRYRFSVPPVHEVVEEDALFVLLPEQGEWKIYERREGWRPLF